MLTANWSLCLLRCVCGAWRSRRLTRPGKWSTAQPPAEPSQACPAQQGRRLSYTTQLGGSGGRKGGEGGLKGEHFSMQVCMCECAGTCVLRVCVCVFGGRLHGQQLHLDLRTARLAPVFNVSLLLLHPVKETAHYCQPVQRGEGTRLPPTLSPFSLP